MEILATLHPDNNPNDDLFPNVKKENIPSKAINLDKLSDEVKNKSPKVISTDTLLPATKLKYLDIDGITYYIPQRVDVTSNIKITGNKNDILSLAIYDSGSTFISEFTVYKKKLNPIKVYFRFAKLRQSRA